MAKIFFAVTFLVLLALAYFYHVLSGDFLLTERDLSIFFIPPRMLWVEAVRNWELPLWNPYSYSGHPLLAVLQPGVFYPLNILFFVLPFDHAFNWLIVLHFMLAGGFTFFLLRETGSSLEGSVAGSTVFMLSGYLLSVHNVISTLFSVAWVPLVLLIYLRAVRRGSVNYGFAAGLFLTVMFFSGGIEVVFGTVILIFFITLTPEAVHGASMPKADAGLVKRLQCFGAALLVFLCLSAAQLLPFLELAGLSTRAGGLSYLEATTWSLDFKDLVQFFIPDPYGYGVTDEKYWSNQSWLKTVYLGAAPFILTLFFFMERKTKALVFAVVALFFLGLAMGKNFFLYEYIYNYIPFFNKIRYPVKFLFVFFLFISISSAMGLDSLRRGIQEKSRGFKFSLITLLFLATVSAVVFGLLNYFDAEVKQALTSRGFDYPEYNRVEINVFNTKRFLFFFIVPSLVVYGALRSLNLRRVLPHLVIILLTTDLFFAHWGFYFITKTDDYHKKGEVMEFLSSDPALFRTFTTPKTMEQRIEFPGDGSLEFDEARVRSLNLDKERITGYNLSHHIFDMWGIEVMKRKAYNDIYNLIGVQAGPDSTNLLAMLNVKYVLSIPPIESTEFRLIKVVGIEGDDIAGLEDLKTLKLYENLNYLPRFFVVDNFTVLKDYVDYMRVMQSKDFEPSKVVLLDEAPKDFPEPPLENDAADSSKKRDDGIEVVEYTNNTIELDADLEGSGILVASESFYPGWKVYVDGKEKRLLKANLILRAVALEKGRHRVRFSYEPASFRTGAAISVLTMTGLSICGLIAMRRRKP